jgi:hypothetical protein
MPFRAKYMMYSMSLPLASFGYYRLINFRKSLLFTFYQIICTAILQFLYKLSNIKCKQKRFSENY